MKKENNVELQLAKEISKYYSDPVGFVMMAFPWGEERTPLAGFKQPDLWQIDF